MNIIQRNPEEASKNNYDLIIIGGGIYGVMLSLVAGDRGMKSLLLEKDDFGGATSYNSLRIIHGGLRYLQSLDLPRFFESVKERRWFLKTFPGLVHPLKCLMPLYGRGLQRTPVFYAALLLNDLLSFDRNSGVSGESLISSGKIISGEEVEKIFPGVDRKNLKSGAVWNDGSIPDPQRVIIELLKLSVSSGGAVLNYCKAADIIKEGNKSAGVEAVDLESGRSFKFYSDTIINSAGPWSREIGKVFDAEYEDLFRPSIAWNILFNRKALSDHALAITPDKPGAKTYFLRPWKGMLFAGTVHEPWSGNTEKPYPSSESIKNFIGDLNNSIPGIDLSENDILHIYAGLLPAKENGSDRIAVREVILNHSEHGGPAGLYSISGVKFTTARLVAEKTLNITKPESANKKRGISDSPVIVNREEAGLFDFNWYPENDSTWKDVLRKIINNESVVHLDDLVVRRTSIGDNPARALDLAPSICGLFGWDLKKTDAEIKRLKDYYTQVPDLYQTAVS